jgi:hypothetical protein
LRFTPNPDKQEVYRQSVQRLLADQLAFLRDGEHQRRVIEANGRDALALAERAARVAQSA